MSTAPKTTILRSQDLNCPSCVRKIEKELHRLDGVTKADVHFSTGRIVVEHDPERAKVDTLIEAVGRAGYRAKASAF
jgi:copper chaperone CopZ